jgi:hypothetical protein
MRSKRQQLLNSSESRQIGTEPTTEKSLYSPTNIKAEFPFTKSITKKLISPTTPIFTHPTLPRYDSPTTNHKEKKEI